MRLSGMLVLGLSCLPGLVAWGCSDDTGGGTTAQDAGSDARGGNPEGGLIPNQDAATDAAGRPITSLCGDVSGLSPDGWPMMGGCPKRPGRSGRLGPSDGPIRYRVSVSVGNAAPVVAADGTVFALTTDGRVVALYTTGVLRDVFTVGGSLRGAPALSSMGTVVVGSPAGELLAVTGADAGPSWSLVTGPVLSALAIGAGNTVYGSGDGKVFSAAIGATKVGWTVTTDDQRGIGPAIGEDGTVYAGSSSGKLTAITREGAVKWTFDAKSPISTAISVSDTEFACFGTDDGTVWSVSTQGEGKVLGKTAGPITGGCAFDADGNVFVGSSDKALHSYTAAGQERWSFATLGAVATPVVGADGKIFVGSADTTVYAVLPSGKLFWAQKVGSKITTALAMGTDGALAVAAEQALVVLGR